MFIKICGITKEEDAIAVTALGADEVLLQSLKEVTGL